jgi:NAD(P)-dependent dehydrogenase (short-subunit alcohol dehydrogenase family)
LESRLALVTGANSGVGRETTRVLAERGWTVLMLCRSLDRGRAALEEIRTEVASAGPAPDLHLLRLDLGDLDDVRRSTREIDEWLDARDLQVQALINNAGLYRAPLERTPQGFERTMAVNHLGHVLLTLELEPRLRRQGVRIVNVSSEGHRRARLTRRPLMEIFRGEGSYGGVQAYCDSKLANVLFSEELQRRWGGDGVSSVAVHPGALATGIWDRNNNLLMWIARLFKPMMGHPSEGGRAVSRLVTEVPAEEMAGRYYKRDEPVDAEPPAGDSDLAAELWRVSEEAVRGS